MWNTEPVMNLRHVDDFSGSRKAPAPGNVRLHYVHLAALDERPESPLSGLLLPSGDEYIDCARYLRRPIVILWME